MLETKLWEATFMVITMINVLVVVVSASSMSNIEKQFLSVPSSESARISLQYITHRSHVAGTKGDFVMAEFVREQLLLAGIPNASQYDLDVLLTYPKSRPRVSLLLQEQEQKGMPKEASFKSITRTLRTSKNDIRVENKEKNDQNKNDFTVLYEAKLSEDIVDIDPTSDTYWRNHTFHGYSPSGTVTAPAIYANYGRPQDFEALQKANIDINGTIVIVRYGQCFRGLKVMNAQTFGALAVLIYSDPADDGYQIGKVYPDGPWRPPSSVQRGSVQFNSKCGGDPMRADKRYGNGNAVTTLCGVDNYTELIPSIPSLPMSYEDVEPLLQHLGGKLAVDVGGEEFVGGLANVTYTVGPSNSPQNNPPTLVRVEIHNKREIRAIPNVIGMIPGKFYNTNQDMPVLLGNHRDAWVFGAADPNSGTSALLEVAKGFGHLLRTTNWQPLRTTYFLSWSGEEYGLLGSTGWAELEFQNNPRLKQSVAYLNVDTLVSGMQLQVSATPSLLTLWNDVIHDLKYHLNTTTTSGNNDPLALLLERMVVLDANIHAPIPHNTDNPSDKTTTTASPAILGSGSDYTVFLDHFGIPSLDFSFHKSQTAQYGVYHSTYDSFTWMDYYGAADAGGGRGSSFDLIALGAKIWGLLALRLASQEILPLDLTLQGKALNHYLSLLQKQEFYHKNHFHIQKLEQAIDLFQEMATKLLEECSSNIESSNATITEDNEDIDVNNNNKGTNRNDKVALCNEKLGLSEREFLTKEGLPKRPWFKHVLQAPGLYLGYAAEAFPGIQQAFDEGNVTLAQEQIIIVTERIESAANFISSAA